jgi:hypothetical protein
MHQTQRRELQALGLADDLQRRCGLPDTFGEL